MVTDVEMIDSNFTFRTNKNGKDVNTKQATELEEQLKAKQDLLNKMQQSNSKTDEALDLLKRKIDADAKERQELHKRMKALEDEKLELIKKSRACIIQ